MIPLPSKSPFSGGEIVVTRFYCPDTDVSVEGRFSVSTPFSQLTTEQLQFVELFIRSEGKMNRMESELQLSYPTIRSRLREIISALGYDPGHDEPPSEAQVGSTLSEDERLHILQELDAGRLSFEEAMTALQDDKE